MFSEEELNSLYRFTCALTNNDDEAFDFVHEALIKTKKYKPKKPYSYTKTVIKNLYFKKYKKSKKESSTETIENISILNDFEKLMINKDSVKVILKSLEPNERILLYEWAIEGKTIKEISVESETKMGTLLSQLSRLKKKLNEEASSGII